MRFCDWPHDFHNTQVLLQLLTVKIIINLAAPAVVRVKMHIRVVLARQNALSKAAPGQGRQRQCFGNFTHSGFIIPMGKAVVVLKRCDMLAVRREIGKTVRMNIT